MEALQEATQAEQEYLNEIEEAGHNLDAIEAYRDNVGEQYTPLNNWENWISEFEYSYVGEMDTREFAEQLAHDLIIPDLPEIASRYFDYEAFERDLFMGDYWENKGHIFRAL